MILTIRIKALKVLMEAGWEACFLTVINKQNIGKELHVTVIANNTKLFASWAFIT